MLISQDGIKNIHESGRAFDLGKWNMASTADNWKPTCEWLDKHLETMCNSIDEEVRTTLPSVILYMHQA